MKKGIIVGTGHAATRLHLPAYRRIGVEIRAFVDVSVENARKVAGENSVHAGYDSIEEAARAERPDFVSICTPPGTHYELTKRAVEAGCHALVEKPVATNYQEACQLKELALKENRVVAVVHNRRFLPGMLQATEELKAGKIGRVLHVDRQMHFCPETVRMMEPDHWAQKLPGGRFFEANPHSLYLVRQFVRNLKVVHTQIFRRSDRWPHARITGFAITLRGENQEGDPASAVVVMSLDNEKVDGRISGTQVTVVHGTRGSMVVDVDNHYMIDGLHGRLATRRPARELISELTSRAVARLKRKSPAIQPTPAFVGDEHGFIIGHFIRQLEGTESEALVSWDEVLETQRLNDEMGAAVDAELQSSNPFQK